MTASERWKGMTEEEQWADWLDFRKRLKEAPSDEEREKIETAYMGPDWDPDDDTVILAGDPEKVERVVRELADKKGGD
jgi:hypothetical protein